MPSTAIEKKMFFVEVYFQNFIFFNYKLQTKHISQQIIKYSAQTVINN